MGYSAVNIGASIFLGVLSNSFRKAVQPTPLFFILLYSLLLIEKDLQSQQTVQMVPDDSYNCISKWQEIQGRENVIRLKFIY